MITKRAIVSMIGLVALGVAGGVAAGQVADNAELPFPAAIANPAAVERAEIRTASGDVVLSGSFVTAPDAGTDVERVAQLTGAAPATGIVEVETSTTNGVTAHELEMSVDDLAASTQYRLVVDGNEIASFTTDADGDAGLEFDSAPNS
jgi:hypothetical protein